MHSRDCHIHSRDCQIQVLASGKHDSGTQDSKGKVPVNMASSRGDHGELIHLPAPLLRTHHQPCQGPQLRTCIHIVLIIVLLDSVTHQNQVLARRYVCTRSTASMQPVHILCHDKYTADVNWVHADMYNCTEDRFVVRLDDCSQITMLV